MPQYCLQPRSYGYLEDNQRCCIHACSFQKRKNYYTHEVDMINIVQYNKMNANEWYLFQIRKSKDYVYGIWVYKALGIWKGYYRVKNHWFHTWNREQRQEIINIWNITPNLHTNSHFEMWAEKWTIMQEPSGSSTAPNAARRIVV